MNIDKLKKKRQLNVQEQNALTKHSILSEALHWQKNGLPQPLKAELELRGINSESSIFLKYEQNYPGLCTDEGIVLTESKEFFEFEADLDFSRENIIEFYSLNNITSKIEVSSHKAGIGATWGYLAIEVLAELKKC